MPDRAACSTSPRRGEVDLRAKRTSRVRGDGPIESHLPPHPTPLPLGEREPAECAASPCPNSSKHPLACESARVRQGVNARELARSRRALEDCRSRQSTDRIPCMSIPHIEPAPDTVHWGFFDARLAPLLAVESGDRVTISTVSGDRDMMPGPPLAIPPALEA